MFKVGDTVTGLPLSNKRYSYTNTRMYEADVTDVRDNVMVLLIRKHKEPNQVGSQYTVEIRNIDNEPLFTLVNEVEYDD